MPSLKSLGVLIAASLAHLGAAAPVAPRDDTTPDVTDKYIVTLKRDISSSEVETHLNWVGDVHKRSLQRRDDLAGVEKVYNISGFHAYAGTFDAAAIKELEENPEVVSVEADQIYTLSAFVTQSGSTWGLGSISSRDPGGNSYRYDDSAGEGTYAYVVDSGINVDHDDFGGRAIQGYNAYGGGFEDTLGHGTHVAGTIGGTTYGVAKSATLIDVKVFRGTESTTSVILQGFNWAADDIVAKGRQARSVINMSLGGPASAVWADAIDAAFEAGILSIAASGNENLSADTRSPANVANALTVGAIDSSWAEPTYSNYGSAVDILAPGSSVQSTYIGSSSATGVLTGTSMAAPHVAGIALYLAVLEDINTPSALKSRILDLSTTGKVSSLRSGSPNKVAYNGNA